MPTAVNQLLKVAMIDKANQIRKQLVNIQPVALMQALGTFLANEN